MVTITELLPQVTSYVKDRNWADVAVMKGRSFRVSPLAKGEYNLNYLLTSTADDVQLVLRINIGTQINRKDQIEYEFKALQLLQGSGVTPKPYFVDDTREVIDRGILIMDYLPGEPLDYQRDLDAAAALLAVVHQIPVDDSSNHLIREDAPLTLIFEECQHLLQRYFESDLADPEIRDYLHDVIIWAGEARVRESYYQADPWPCIINTEVNSGNFIADRRRNTLYLVDWEMPRWGDPSQDLCHFCSPLTTLWKTAFQMTPIQKANFIDRYRRRMADPHLRDTLIDRVRLRDPFVFLRGISWSAMGWVAYQTEFAGMKNPDTWTTLQRYMDIDFIRSVFDPIIV